MLLLQLVKLLLWATAGSGQVGSTKNNSHEWTCRACRSLSFCFKSLHCNRKSLRSRPLGVFFFLRFCSFFPIEPVEFLSFKISLLRLYCSCLVTECVSFFGRTCA